ncbi:GNAT family N-acetyltransferase [Pseudemcibacter aquimaris]|uniref:GNAT family N-acetyltransferase n=1 Tax=Pseudemcibacter aquimaris TaxID=2857064 RepID=UPI002011C0D3|nr:GNAT family N-acyltransferase [Pseudemcibacter aquimaris]MCC3862505.1 GNAT family N-acetyltransferase [Pseudemcibacter aquimaris]WDU57767.1 GNAT family N-acetyltransferase [Pseudemcibacter aquimaris]
MTPLKFNSLEVKLAETSQEIEAAQALRYRIFYDEMGAKPSTRCKALKRDIDTYDIVCDHLIVVDTDLGTDDEPAVVGTYRLLRGNVAEATTGFYSENEFEFDNLAYAPEEVLELGRSCIDSKYRRRGAMQLLWRGISDYLDLYNIKIMIGCGSIHGTDVKETERVLSYLHHYHLAPSSLRPVALADRYQEMNLIDEDYLDAGLIQAELPPLLKGYLRVGAYVGDGAVIDRQFNTIDVCIVVETENITGKYKSHFKRDKARTETTEHAVQAS